MGGINLSSDLVLPHLFREWTRVTRFPISSGTLPFAARGVGPNPPRWP
jgi:hypothetical protein